MEQCKAIDICIEQKLVLPSLCLIYAGIDSAAWVAYGDISVKKRFVDFVSNFMYKEKPLDPRPIDLYAARCAILHTMTPDSNLSNNNQAVRISYAWGNASLEALKKSTEALSLGELSCVHLNDLSESFKLGLARFVENDTESEACTIRMQKHYSILSKEIVTAFNNLNI